MKKIILYLSFLVLAVAGCTKVEDSKLADPDKRLAAELSKNESLLVSAPNGWKAQIYPKGGKGYAFYFKFTADGKVDMLSDFNAESAGTLKQSTWRLKALQRPTLIFDTYSYIHLLSDPTASISGGTTGKGLTSDFEFAFTTTDNTGDSLKLEGIVNQNAMTYVRATAAEEQAILLQVTTATLCLKKCSYVLETLSFAVMSTKILLRKLRSFTFVINNS